MCIYICICVKCKYETWRKSIVTAAYRSTPALIKPVFQSTKEKRDIWHLFIYLFNATSRKVTGSILDEVIVFFNWRNPSSRTMALGSSQFLTEMSTRNVPGGKEQQVRKVDNLTAICEPIM
jgi:hypothetical protein